MKTRYTLFAPHCVLLFLTALLLSACARVSDKTDVVIGKERFTCARCGTGAPTVVLEAGLGGGMDAWAAVYDKVASFTTVFAYDRRGYNESGQPAGSLKTPCGNEIVQTVGETVLDAVVPGASLAMTLGSIATRSTVDPTSRTGAAVIADLHEVLQAANIHPPYILVGHSLGGLYMSLYARTYPHEVAAIVLLDSMHPEQIERCKLYLPEEECDPKRYPWWVKTLIRMSPGVIKAEMEGAVETGRQIRAAGPLPSVPLVIVSHGEEEDPARDRMWAALQQHLAGESPHSVHIIARKSGHNIQNDEPELVVETIRDLVMQAKKEAAAPQ